jgi:hypothetical protein
MPDHVKLVNIAYCLCQVALNRKLSGKFEKWCKFSGQVKLKMHKMGPA